MHTPLERHCICLATRQTIAEDVLNRKHEGLASIVIDLEDAVGDLQIELAEETLIQQLDQIEYYVIDRRAGD